MFESGLGFSFGKPYTQSLRVRNRPLSLSTVAFSSLRFGTFGAQNENLHPLFNTNLLPISETYGLRIHF